MAQLQSTTITGTLTLPSYVAGFIKLNASGAVTMDTNTYITGVTSGMITTALGYTPVPTTRTLTINGTAYDLSADRSWTITAGVSSVNAGTGISVNQTTGAVTVTNTGVLSINGSTGAVTGIITTSNYNSYSPTLTGGGASGTWGINITGNAATATSATTASNSNAVNGLTVNQIFNNQGSLHGAYTNFDSVSVFGPYFIQGTTSGPGTGSSQFYGISLGLGNEYPYSQYVMQMAIPRDNSTDRYISYRTRENTTWGSWNKIWAGYADTSGNSSTTSQTNFTTLTLNSATVATQSWVTSQGYLPTGGGSMSGTLTVASPGNYWATNITGLTSAPLFASWVNVGSVARYVPLTHMAAQYTAGYRTHVSTGIYKEANGWAASWYMAIGGNDSYPTEAFYLNYGGSIGHSNGYVTINGSVRAPIFYDSANTGYYLDPAGTSRLGGGTDNNVIEMVNGNWGAWFMIGGWSTDTTYARLRVSNGNIHMDSKGGGYDIYLNWYTNRPVYFGGDQQVNGTIYDYSNTAYYLKPSSSSVLYSANINRAQVTNDITSSSGMGRFGGWYQGTGYTGLAAEIGISGGAAYVISYNRSTASYANLNFEASNISISGSTNTSTVDIVTYSNYKFRFVGGNVL